MANTKIRGSTQFINDVGYIGAANSIYGEIPSGTIDGSNKVFTLANTPTVGTVRVYLNGLRQSVTGDYTIVGGTLTFVNAPLSGDILVADYMK